MSAKPLGRKFAHSTWKRLRDMHRVLFLRRQLAWRDALRRAEMPELSGPGGLTRGEARSIQAFWRDRYGIPVNISYYDFVRRFTGAVPDPRYVSDETMLMYLLPAFSPVEDARVFQDKSLYGFYFPDVHRPREIVRAVRGAYYGEGNESIDLVEAVRRVVAYGRRVCVKPTVDSGEGKGVVFFVPANGEDTARMLEALHGNFTVQEVVAQSPETAALNPTSLNTFRVESLFLGGRFSLLAAVLRVGGKGHEVDNVGAGGFGVGVGSDGALQAIGHDSAGHAIAVGHDGLPLAGRGIPSFPRIADFVERLHRRLPYVPFVAWDIALDASGEPLLVELNCTRPGVGYVQLASGPLFGDRFDEVMEYVTSPVKRATTFRHAAAFRPDAHFPEVYL